jgi:5-methylthioadenosine/S-adenosylhomocysteine deaminase
MIANFSVTESLPLMMHAAETAMEVSLMREGRGPFAEGLRRRGIEWHTPGVSTIQYLSDHGVLETRPLLAHCIHVDEADLELLKQSRTRVAHCPKSNAKLGHGVAPFARFQQKRITVGLGSDSVASNNTCDLLEEARFALLLARAAARTNDHGPKEPGNDDGRDDYRLSAEELFQVATLGGARVLDLQGQIGELREGVEADFAVIALNGTHQIPSYDPASTLIFGSSGRDVVLTVVAGKDIYRHGQVTTVDEDRLRARMKEIATKLQ